MNMKFLEHPKIPPYFNKVILSVFFTMRIALTLLMFLRIAKTLFTP